MLNPSSAGQASCGLFAGGIFKKECWCLEYPSLSSSSDYVAARALADPSVYAALQAPPVVGAPTGSTPPADAAQAQAQIDEILAQQLAAWKAQNAATLAETQANLDRIASEQPQVTCFFGTATQAEDGTWSCGGTNWLLYGGIALGVFALVAIGGGSPRRYGR